MSENSRGMEELAKENESLKKANADLRRQGLRRDLNGGVDKSLMPAVAMVAGGVGLLAGTEVSMHDAAIMNKGLISEREINAKQLETGLVLDRVKHLAEDLQKMKQKTPANINKFWSSNARELSNILDNQNFWMGGEIAAVEEIINNLKNICGACGGVVSRVRELDFKVNYLKGVLEERKKNSGK